MRLLVVVSCLLATGCDLVFAPGGADSGDDDCVNAGGEPDEDADGRPDRCDPCPFLAGFDADNDGDGVGDACDPDKVAGGDERLLFLGFTDVTCGADLSYCGGASFVEGDLVFGDGEVLIPGVFDGVTVTIGFATSDLDPDAGYRETGIILAASPPGTDDVQGCYVNVGSEMDGTDYLELYRIADGLPDLPIEHEDFGELELDGLTATLRCTYAGATASCALEAPNGVFTIATAEIDLQPAALGLHGMNLRSRIHYIDIVRRSPTKR